MPIFACLLSRSPLCTRPQDLLVCALPQLQLLLCALCAKKSRNLPVYVCFRFSYSAKVTAVCRASCLLLPRLALTVVPATLSRDPLQRELRDLLAHILHQLQPPCQGTPCTPCLGHPCFAPISASSARVPSTQRTLNTPAFIHCFDRVPATWKAPGHPAHTSHRSRHPAKVTRHA